MQSLTKHDSSTPPGYNWAANLAVKAFELMFPITSINMRTILAVKCEDSEPVKVSQHSLLGMMLCP